MAEAARLRDRWFKPRNDDKAIEAIKTALVNSDYTVEEANKAAQILQRRPLIRHFVLATIEEEAVAGNEVTAQGQIDWENLGDFLLKIAPLIMELIEMFL